jgi:hypothetical protein
VAFGSPACAQKLQNRVRFAQTIHKVWLQIPFKVRPPITYLQPFVPCCTEQTLSATLDTSQSSNFLTTRCICVCSPLIVSIDTRTGAGFFTIFIVWRSDRGTSRRSVGAVDVSSRRPPTTSWASVIRLRLLDIHITYQDTSTSKEANTRSSVIKRHMASVLGGSKFLRAVELSFSTFLMNSRSCCASPCGLTSTSTRKSLSLTLLIASIARDRASLPGI